MNDISVLIYSCDKYSDVWGPFFTLLFRYWDCPYQIYLATESEQCLLPEIKTINHSAATWTERIKATLQDIPTMFVIGMCEDMFIRQPVRQKIIDNCLNAMKNDKGIACFNFECFREQTDGGPFANFGRKTRNAEFKKSCQPTLWRKPILEELLMEPMDAWEWESTPANDKYQYFVYTGPESEAVFEYGYHNGEWFGIQKGKWVESDVKPLFEKENINIDLSIRGVI